MDIFDNDVSHADLINELRQHLDEKVNKSLSDHDCLRFLRARPGAMDKSIEMIHNWFTWRHTLLEPLPPDNLRYTPNTILSMVTTLDEHPAAHLLPVAHHGFDRHGHPIYWEKTGLIQSQFSKVRQHFEVFELIQYSILSREIFCCRFDYASQVFNQPMSQWVVVNDMKGLTISLDMESIWYMKQVLQIDANYYPERLFRLFLINCPWYFPAIFNIFSPFIDQRTRNKFRILGTNYASELEELIDPSVIPSDYGGTNESVKWDLKPLFESGGSKEQIRQCLDKHLKDLAVNCKESEYQTLKEALKLTKKFSELKQLIDLRLSFVSELNEDQVAELNESREESAESNNAEENDKPEGFTKENILKRLKVDLEQTERILIENGMKECDNGEIDGGGDDGGGRRDKKISAEEEVGDDEFQDAR